MECPNVHIILSQVVAHGFLRKWVFTHSYQALQMNSNNVLINCFQYFFASLKILLSMEIGLKSKEFFNNEF